MFIVFVVSLCLCRNVFNLNFLKNNISKFYGFDTDIRNWKLEPLRLSNCPILLRLEAIRSDQSLSHVRLFATPWIAARQASLSITNSRSSLRFTSIQSVMPSSHLILCCPLFLLPPIPPRIRYFPMSQLFTWGGQSTGVSALASFFSKNTQGWSSEWTGWISLQSKGLSRVFSNTTLLQFSGWKANQEASPCRRERGKEPPSLGNFKKCVTIFNLKTQVIHPYRQLLAQTHRLLLQ